MFGAFLEFCRRYPIVVWQAVSGRHLCRRPRPLLHGLLLLPGLGLLGLWLLLQWLGLLLDEILFRGYRRVAVREPVFIVGLPRSGTTLLHRTLAADPRFTTFSLGECLLTPSLTARWLARGLGRLDRFAGRPLGRLTSWSGRRLTGEFDAVHPTDLHAPEEDYLVLLPVLACFILLVPLPVPAIGRLGYFDRDIDPGTRRRLMRFYRACLQKHLYWHGADRRLLSKNAAFAPLLGSLTETFPDARLIACLRDPVELVPSQLGSLDTGLRLCGHDPQDPAFVERVLELLGYQFGRILEAERSGIPISLLTLEAFRCDLENSVLHLYAHLDMMVDSECRDRLQRQAMQAAGYRSRHRHAPGRYGLDPARIRARFAEVYARCDFERGISRAA